VRCSPVIGNISRLTGKVQWALPDVRTASVLRLLYIQGVLLPQFVAPPLLNIMSSTQQNCGSGGGDDRFFGLRVASVFIILIGSAFGAFFPIISARTKWLSIPPWLYKYGSFLIYQRLHLIVPSFAKFFGSGVIVSVIPQRSLSLSEAVLQIATAFIHLLASAVSELTSPCLSAAWGIYVGFYPSLRMSFGLMVDLH
jgi:hypothetical protein